MNMDSYRCTAFKHFSENQIEDLSALLKVIGEYNRLRLLFVLYSCGCHCVCDFENHAEDMSQSLISHHLADLKNAGLVTSEKEGLKVNYRLTDFGREVCSKMFLLLSKEDHMENEENTTCCCCGKECNYEPNKTKDGSKKCCESCQCDKKTCIENCKKNCDCCKNGGCEGKDSAKCEECC